MIYTTSPFINYFSKLFDSLSVIISLYASYVGEATFHLFIASKILSAAGVSYSNSIFNGGWGGFIDISTLEDTSYIEVDLIFLLVDFSGDLLLLEGTGSSSNGTFNAYLETSLFTVSTVEQSALSMRLVSDSRNWIDSGGCCCWAVAAAEVKDCLCFDA